MFDFLRIVNEIKPPFFVMENVRGILSAAIKHKPLTERIVKNYWSEPDEKPGSVMRLLKERFTEMGYTVTAQLVLILPIMESRRSGSELSLLAVGMGIK